MREKEKASVCWEGFLVEFQGAEWLCTKLRQKRKKTLKRQVCTHSTKKHPNVRSTHRNLAKMRCKNRQLKKCKGAILVTCWKSKKFLVPNQMVCCTIKWECTCQHWQDVHNYWPVFMILVYKFLFCPYDQGTLSPFHEHLVSSSTTLKAKRSIVTTPRPVGYINKPSLSWYHIKCWTDQDK